MRRNDGTVDYVRERHASRRERYLQGKVAESIQYNAIGRSGFETIRTDTRLKVGVYGTVRDR